MEFLILAIAILLFIGTTYVVFTKAYIPKEYKDNIELEKSLIDFCNGIIIKGIITNKKSLDINGKAFITSQYLGFSFSKGHLYLIGKGVGKPKEKLKVFIRGDKRRHPRKFLVKQVLDIWNNELYKEVS